MLKYGLLMYQYIGDSMIDPRDVLNEKRGNAEALKRIFGILTEDEYRETKKRFKELEGEFEK